PDRPQGFRERPVGRVRQLAVARVTLDEADGPTRALEERHLVGPRETVAEGGGVGLAEPAEAGGLRRLHPPQPLARDRLAEGVALGAPEGVGDGYGEGGSSVRPRRFRDR